MREQVEKVTTTTSGVEPRRGYAGVSTLTQVVWFISGVITALILTRVTLSLLGANTQNAFASFIYSWSDPLVAPFRGLLQQGEFQAGVSRLELESLVAMAVYILVGWGIGAAINIGRRDV